MRKLTYAIAGALVAAGVIAPVAASAAAPVPVVFGFDCVTSFCHPHVRPSGQFFGSGGTLFLRGLKWGHWNHTSARGHGVRWANICKPTCSAGNFHKRPVSVRLYDIRHHNGRAYFWHETLRWSQKNGVQHVDRYTYAKHGGSVDFWDQVS